MKVPDRFYFVYAFFILPSDNIYKSDFYSFRKWHNTFQLQTFNSRMTILNSFSKLGVNTFFPS